MKNKEDLDKYRRDSQRKFKYGITDEQYTKMLEDQRGVCAACKKPEVYMQNGRVCALSVDHDKACCPGRRSCGKCIRGLLCSRCNLRAYGTSEELFAIGDYLKSWELRNG